MNALQNARFKIKLLVVSCSILLIDSCQENQIPFIEPAHGSNLKEFRLGESDYYLNLPDNLRLLEARGKEGQLGYNIIPKDTFSTMFAFIEIVPGKPIGDLSEDRSATAFAQSYLSNKKVKWKIHKTETGYFDSFSTENGDLSARASSRKRTEIDSLISIIATLKKK